MPALFRIPYSILVVFLVCATVAARGDEVRLRCTADTNLSSYETEQEFNYGAASHLRLKGIQMLALFQFDTMPVKGWKVDRAWLHLRYAGAERKLRTLGVSTVSAPWEEGTGTGEPKTGQVSFRWRANGRETWAGPHTDFTDVAYSTGHTLAAYADAQEAGNDWIVVPVDRRLVQAMLAGATYGLAVSDEKGQTMANNDVYSREQYGSEPYLVVTGHPAAGESPPPVRDLRVLPDAAHADFSQGAARVTFTAEPGTFAFDVHYRVAGAPHEQTAPRYVIPFATPGQQQTVRLVGLPPRARLLAVEVVSVGETGARGEAARASGAASAAKPQPAPLAVTPPPIPSGPEPPVRPGGIRIWAYPDTEKAHPVSGNLLEEVGPDRYAGPPAGVYRRANGVWDGKRVRLYAARKEIVAFHLLVEAARGPLRGVTLRPPGLFRPLGPGRPWTPRCWVFRDWYVRDGDWFPEACVPLTGGFDIPAADNAVPGQKNQSVFLDLLVPRTAVPGRYLGTMRLTAAGAASVPIPIEVTVNPLVLPDALSFDISLNTYGTVGSLYGIDDRTPEYRALERQYFRLAHLHRATYAPLGYSHSGNISTNYAPPLEGSGAGMRVRDWTAWDQQFAAYLDGSAFRDLPRSGVPITHLYLPFHEAWPADIREHYRYRATTTAYPAMIVEHALKAPPIEEAFDQQFRDAFVAVVRQFAQHFRQKDWTRTRFQFYQNDKYYYKDPQEGGRGTSWWLLDEPNARDDWLALAFFARLLRAGMQGFPDVPVIVREDISEPQWQRDTLDGLVDLMVVSRALYEKGPLLREMHERLGVRYWNYGTANAVRQSNVEAETWALHAWIAGADGIVPWQTVGSDANLDHAEATALLLPGKRFGIEGPIASLRLKALRRAQQDIEYVTQLAQARRWDREQTAAALSGIVRRIDGSARQGANLRAADFAALRRAVAEGTVLPPGR